MLPQVSENLHSILIAIGLFLLGYAIYEYTKTFKEHDEVKTTVYDLHGRLDSVRIEKKINRIESDHSLMNLYERQGIKGGISIDDTAFIQKVNLLPVSSKIKDSLELIYLQYRHKVKALSIIQKNTMAKHQYLNYIRNKPMAYILTCLLICLCGFGIFFLGYYGIQKQQLLRDRILMHQQTSLSVDVVRCQSCGKRFSSMVRYGKEKNGKLSKSFCNSCYHNGKFTEPDLTFVQMKNRSLYSDDVSFFKRRKVARILKKLDRWNDDHYEDIFDRL
jgi:hypothetical protein